MGWLTGDEGVRKPDCAFLAGWWVCRAGLRLRAVKAPGSRGAEESQSPSPSSASLGGPSWPSSVTTPRAHHKMDRKREEWMRLP